MAVCNFAQLLNLYLLGRACFLAVKMG